MNITSVFYKFPDQEACIAYLEEIRWGDDAHCPHCGSTSVARKDDQGRIGRWNCHGCKSSFNVLAGTIFENTKDTPSKVVSEHCSDYQCQKSLSSCQLARDLDMNQRSAWFMQQRIRAQMAGKQGEILLQGLLNADETYVGGKPRKRNKPDNNNDLSPPPRIIREAVARRIVFSSGRGPPRSKPKKRIHDSRSRIINSIFASNRL